MKGLRFILILWVVSGLATAGEPIDLPEQGYYPDVWAHAGSGGHGLYTIISWTKYGKPVPYDSHEVLLNGCGGKIFCGTFFFSGKHLPKGTWHRLSEVGTDYIGYIQVELPQGSLLNLAMLKGSQTTTSPDGISLADGGRVRLGVPDILTKSPDYDCQYIKHGLSFYLERLMPNGQQAWAKYVFVSPKKRSVYEETNMRSVMYGTTFKVAALQYFFVSTDHKDIFLSDGEYIVVRIDAATGKMGEGLPRKQTVQVDEYWGWRIGKSFDIRVVDANQVLEFYKEMVSIPPHESWENVGATVPYGDNCPKALNDQIYKRFFEGA